MGSEIYPAWGSIPAGTALARFALFDETTTPKSDFDLYVYKADGKTMIGGSGGSTSAEQVDLTNLAAGTYVVEVYGWATTRRHFGTWSGKPDSNRRPSAWERTSRGVHLVSPVRKGW